MIDKHLQQHAGFTVQHVTNKFKNYSPQSHRGHREKHCIVHYATGAVNKVKLCVLWGEMLLCTDRRVRTVYRPETWFRFHNYVMAIMSALALSGLLGCK
jgi:hypothetical protein